MYITQLSSLKSLVVVDYNACHSPLYFFPCLARGQCKMIVESHPSFVYLSTQQYLIKICENGLDQKFHLQNGFEFILINSLLSLLTLLKYRKLLIADARKIFLSQVPESLKEDLIQRLRSFSRLLDAQIKCWTLDEASCTCC